MNTNTNRQKPPSYYEAEALIAQRAERWKEAADLWQLASSASRGLNRKSRYDRAQEECLKRTQP